MSELALTIDAAAIERELALPGNLSRYEEHLFAEIGRRHCQRATHSAVFAAAARALRPSAAAPNEDASGPPPILVENGDVIVLKAAVRLVNRNERTIRRWCKRYRIARQAGPAAPLEISAPALLMVASGDTMALELLRSGDRQHPRVSRYFDHLGVSPHRPRPCSVSGRVQLP